MWVVFYPAVGPSCVGLSFDLDGWRSRWILHTHTTDSVGDQDSIFRREKPDEKIQLEVPLNNATT